MGIGQQSAPLRGTCASAERSAAPLRGDTAAGRAGLAQAPGQALVAYAPSSESHDFAKGKVVEIYSGEAGNARASANIGLRADAWDVIDRPEADVCRPRDRKRLEAAIRAHSVLALLFGQPSQSWSRARKDDGLGPGPVRNDSDQLWGKLHMNSFDEANVKLGNKLWLITFRLACLAARRGVLIVIENP
jgi:hypothetical protein